MPSLNARLLFTAVSRRAFNLHEKITITDAWYPNEGGNVRVADEASTRHSMASVMAGINQLKDRAPDQGFERNIRQDSDSWLSQGRKTLESRTGVCTDCAAAAALEVCGALDNLVFREFFRVEIVSTGRHAMVLVGRDGNHIKNMGTWGPDAFLVDVWLQNQYPKGRVPGACWAADQEHGSAIYLRNQQGSLRVDATLREQLGPLF